MHEPFDRPEKPIEVALYDRELGSLDYQLFNAHTGRQEPHNGWIKFRRAPFTSDVAIFTDRMLGAVRNSPHRVNIAWLLESPELMRKQRREIVALEGFFDRILTFDRFLLQRSDRYVFCPMGGSWIPADQWAIYPKTKNVSIFCSKQNYLTGHKMRFAVVRKYSEHIQGVFGRAFKPLENKVDGLKDYRFSIAIENCRRDFYFTEKLIDCFATGTVPIYWGCPGIGRFFDPSGILSFGTTRQLKNILGSISHDLYNSLLPAVEHNFRLAASYRIVEQHMHMALKGWSKLAKPVA
jgi:hypothetical protein